MAAQLPLAKGLHSSKTKIELKKRQKCHESLGKKKPNEIPGRLYSAGHRNTVALFPIGSPRRTETGALETRGVRVRAALCLPG